MKNLLKHEWSKDLRKANPELFTKDRLNTVVAQKVIEVKHTMRNKDFYEDIAPFVLAERLNDDKILLHTLKWNFSIDKTYNLKGITELWSMTGKHSIKL